MALQRNFDRRALIHSVLQVNANGNVVRSEILGAVKMKCYLSGMPELRLGLNDKIMFESTGRSESGHPAHRVVLLIPLLSRSRKSHRDGGRQIPPVRPSISLRE